MAALIQSRRSFIKTSALVVTGIALPVYFPVMAQKNKSEYLVYTGAYTKSSDEGINIFKLKTETGELQHLNTVTGISNPSFLAIDPQNKYLYAVNEISDYQGRKSGAVTAFSIDHKNYSLKLLNQRASFGESPCYVQVDKSGKSLMVANYGGGNITIYPILEGGQIGEASKVIDHNNEQTDENAHAHCIIPDPENNFALAVDLGVDKIFIYKLDPGKAMLTPHSSLAFKDGAGPRHVTFHPNKKYAYCINELNSTVSALKFDKTKGTLTELQTITTLPKEYKGDNSCADIHVSPDGRFLYGSNRGHNSIVIYSIDQTTGQLTHVDHASTLGDWPRNFSIDPTGKVLLVAHQKSNDIFTFFIDNKTGKLNATGKRTELPSPVFLTVVPISS